MSTFKTDDRVVIKLSGLADHVCTVIDEYSPGVYQLRAGSGEEFLMSTHVLRLVERSPAYDKPGTVRRYCGMAAVKIRHDYWVIIRDNDQEPLRFGDDELTGSPVVIQIPESPAAADLVP